MQSLVYDAVHLLGFGPASTEPLPHPARGEIVIRVGDWSLFELRSNPLIMRRKLIDDEPKDADEEYLLEQADKESFNIKKLTPGVYSLRLPVPESGDKSFDEQQSLLRPDEEVAPVALVATALIVHLMQTGSDLLNGDSCRCKELDFDDLEESGQITLSISKDQLEISKDSIDHQFHSIVFAASRKC